MQLKVAHSIPGRVRFRTDPDVLGLYRHTAVAQMISDIPGVRSAEVNSRTGSILLHYDTIDITENKLAAMLKAFPMEEFPKKEPGTKGKSLVWSYIGYQIYRSLIPWRLRPYTTVLAAIPFIVAGLKSLMKRRMDVPLLDASAITASLMQRNFKSASTLIMLLKTGDYLERWAKERSRDNLASTISLNVGHVWIRKRGQDTRIPYSQLKTGDKAVVRAGAVIPVDGTVLEGNAMVNESSMTGEPLSIDRSEGETVHAGSVIEEGELVIRVLQKGENTRFQKIVQLIQESESAKAQVETKANEIADKVVPFNFAVAGGTYAITRNTMKASAALSVDYSCAVKLSTPLVFLSSMRESLNNGVFFKGGVSIEAFAKADTIVFDKTGTLTKATPEIEKIIAYNGYTEREVLKISACLEEHFPHPMAKAVVKHALKMDVEHQEEHSEVKYIVAHGIATKYKNEHTVIGSRHFIKDDEGIDISICEKDEIKASEEGYSVLYLARAGKLAGLLYINDPIRQEAKEVIAMLRHLGIKRFYMLTGDNKHTAARVAEELGIDSFRGEILPHEKSEIVKRLKSKGCNVAVVGDGMNDAPALSEANVGIAMKGGADLAQEVADITMLDPSLYPLVIARLTSMKAMERIKYNNISAVGINTALMFLSIIGRFTPTASVWLHNLTTLGISLNSMRPLLPKGH